LTNRAGLCRNVQAALLMQRPAWKKEAKQMSTLTVPGAQVFYKVEGDGALLILIPGASGTGESFRPLSHALSAWYRVVTYDRRGFSQSRLDGPQEYEQRLETDADDVRRLIKSLTSQPAIVFGNSSGALVALEVLTRYPEHIRTVVAHEPPAVKLLPDATKWLALFDGVYATFRAEGIPQAMDQFGSLTLGSAGRQVLEHVRREHPSEANTRYWLEHELRQYPRVELDLDALAAHARQLVLVGGRDSHNQMTYQPGKVLAERLGLTLLDVPGGHLGFLDTPAEFATGILNALGSESQ